VKQQMNPVADFEAIVAHEHSISASVGGRSVGRRRTSRELAEQLNLSFG
jgi:hypothetical protein